MDEIGSINWEQLSEYWYQKRTVTKSGRTKLTYHYKLKTNRPSLALEINTPIAKQIAAYQLIEKDLEDTLAFLDIQQKHLNEKNPSINNMLLKALLRSIVITYGKCFTKPNGRGVKLEEKLISQKNRSLHSTLMNMRHEYVAHAGTSEHESCKLILLIPPEKKFLKGQRVQAEYHLELRQTMYHSADFRPLIQELRDHVKEKLESLRSKDSLKDIEPEKLYKFIKNKKGRIKVTQKNLESMINRSR